MGVFVFFLHLFSICGDGVFNQRVSILAKNDGTTKLQK